MMSTGAVGREAATGISQAHSSALADRTGGPSGAFRQSKIRREVPAFQKSSVPSFMGGNWYPHFYTELGWEGIEMAESRIRYGQLRRVFRAESGGDFDAHLAQLCVLYEDLRIELLAITIRSMAHLDVLDPAAEHRGDKVRIGRYRRHYFLRRSFATIREFAECLGAMRKTEEFQAIKSRVEPSVAKTLDDAVIFFSTNSGMIRTVRNSTGGHFGLEAGRYAIKHVDASAIGKLEFALEKNKVNVKLHFAGELVATAFTDGLPGKTMEEKIRNAVQGVAESYRHAARVVQIMIATCMMDRFGK
jgi:hypothetical protein